MRFNAIKYDPFNSFAIARLRILAFQKAVVMKYVDNLLDWGDELFAQDTVESLNEATMLYVMAADLLGDRPVEVGGSGIGTEFLLTYRILSHQRSGSEFLIELENLYVTLAFLNVEALNLPLMTAKTMTAITRRRALSLAPRGALA